MIWALKGDRTGDRTADIDAERDSGDGRDPRRLVCVRCQLPITSEHARIEVLGQHEHTCTNPHGFAYRIGCFAAAPGCVGVGQPESFWSWFPGYSWQLVLCRACHAHLGWLFRAADSGFHGLILDRLAPEP